MRHKSVFTFIFLTIILYFHCCCYCILLKFQKLQWKMLTNDESAMLNSSFKFKSLGEIEDFLSSVLKVFVAVEIIPGKGNHQTSFI